jgi:hypothetical protein
LSLPATSSLRHTPHASPSARRTYCYLHATSAATCMQPPLLFACRTHCCPCAAPIAILVPHPLPSFCHTHCPMHATPLV